jgi:hypothetical protein
MITRRNKYVHCPLCRKKTPLPKRGVRFLPTNSVVRRLLDRFGEALPTTTRSGNVDAVPARNLAMKCEVTSGALKKLSSSIEKDVQQFEQRLRKKEKRLHKDIKMLVKRYKTQAKKRQKILKTLV